MTLYEFLKDRKAVGTMEREGLGATLLREKVGSTIKVFADIELKAHGPYIYSEVYSVGTPVAIGEKPEGIRFCIKSTSSNFTMYHLPKDKWRFEEEI